MFNLHRLGGKNVGVLTYKPYQLFNLHNYSPVLQDLVQDPKIMAPRAGAQEHVKMHTFYKTDALEHVKMRTFYKTDAQEHVKMHTFYKTDAQEHVKNAYIL